MRIEKDYVELIIGLGQCPLQYPAITTAHWSPKTWITNISTFLHNSEVSIKSSTPGIMRIQRKGDFFLMERVGHLSKSAQTKIQQYRLYLQVSLLSDVYTVQGNKLELTAFSGNHRKISLNWPTQHRPSQATWTEWKKFLRYFTNYAKGQNINLHQRYNLGEWKITHQTWKWMGNHKRIINMIKMKLTTSYRKHAIIKNYQQHINKS